MTNRIAIIPIGDSAAAQEIASLLSPEGKPIELKNKYFEASLSLDFDGSGKPPAVLWISHSKYCDLMPPPSGQYSDSELRLLLRVVDKDSNEKIPKALQDWEIDNFAEIINVNLDTFEEEIKKFSDGSGRGSLLDEEQQPAGCRILEALEMVSWPIKVTAGKPLIEQKIEKLTELMKVNDPECDAFSHAMSLMMELKSEIANLQDKERYKYAGEVAMAFQKMLFANIEEEEEEETNDKKGEYSSFEKDLPQPSTN